MTTIRASSDFNQQIVDEFRANEGRVGGPFAGAAMLLLTTTGAKTGKQTVSPLVYTDDGDRLLIYGSKGGAPTHPVWFHNLKANPEVTVEVGTETFAARAEEITGEERDRLWAAHVKRAPGFGEYEKKTTRTIPVIALYRTDW